MGISKERLFGRLCNPARAVVALEDDKWLRRDFGDSGTAGCLAACAGVYKKTALFWACQRRPKRRGKLCLMRAARALPGQYFEGSSIICGRVPFFSQFLPHMRARRGLDRQKTANYTSSWQWKFDDEG